MTDSIFSVNNRNLLQINVGPDIQKDLFYLANAGLDKVLEARYNNFVQGTMNVSIPIEQFGEFAYPAVDYYRKFILEDKRNLTDFDAASYSDLYGYIDPKLKDVHFPTYYLYGNDIAIAGRVGFNLRQAGIYLYLQTLLEKITSYPDFWKEIAKRINEKNILAPTTNRQITTSSNVLFAEGGQTVDFGSGHTLTIPKNQTFSYSEQTTRNIGPVYVQNVNVPKLGDGKGVITSQAKVNSIGYGAVVGQLLPEVFGSYAYTYPSVSIKDEINPTDGSITQIVTTKQRKISTKMYRGFYDKIQSLNGYVSRPQLKILATPDLLKQELTAVLAAYDSQSKTYNQLMRI